MVTTSPSFDSELQEFSDVVQFGHVPCVVVQLSDESEQRLLVCVLVTAARCFQYSYSFHASIKACCAATKSLLNLVSSIGN